MHNAESVLLSFANLLEVAHMCSGGADVYAKQGALVSLCRSTKRPFLATMPLRSRYKCTVCGMESGQAELHFEDPSQPLEGEPNSLWLNPVGAFVDIEMSELHSILVHGANAPASLQALLAKNGG